VVKILPFFTEIDVEETLLLIRNNREDSNAENREKLSSLNLPSEYYEPVLDSVVTLPVGNRYVKYPRTKIHYNIFGVLTESVKRNVTCDIKYAPFYFYSKLSQ
jgi:hypothetical protein